jgi:hypothetical protein
VADLHREPIDLQRVMDDGGFWAHSKWLIKGVEENFFYFYIFGARHCESLSTAQLSA